MGLFGLIDNSFTALKKGLDESLSRHSRIASNIANSETPNYKAASSGFEGHMQSAFKNNDMQTSRPGIDNNNVDLDRELGHLVENDIRHAALSQMTKKKFSTVLNAISLLNQRR